MLRHSDEFVHHIGALLSHRSPCLPCHMAAGDAHSSLSQRPRARDRTKRGYTDTVGM